MRTNADRLAQQGEVVRFLCDPAHWPAPVERVEHLQTHVSHLFLGGDLALKMKKAVRLPYLDFSTLEQRERFCRRELAVNARFSPEIYLGLSRVARMRDGALALDPPEATGETVEWLVRMWRFSQDAILARHVEKRPPDAALARALAAMACAAHRRAETRPDADSFATLTHVWRQVRDALTPQAAAPGGSVMAEALDALRKRLEAARPVLGARARQGFVRRCHGDMHLGNIVLLDGEPRLFDAIEFDEALATIDVLYDIAFLLMDLAHRGFRDAANRVFNGWLARCDDVRNHAAAALAAPMMALRAFIRAMVAVDLAQQQAGGERAASMAQAAEYARTAEDCLHPAKVALIAVGGLSGTGKTTLASRLAATLAPGSGMVHLRSDVERKMMEGVEETDRLPPSAYTPEASRRTYDRLYERAAAALSSPWPVVVDAVFAKEEERAAIERVSREAGVPFIGLWLEAPAAVLRARVSARTGDASDADVAVLEKQLGYDLGAMHWRSISAQNAPEEVLARALAVLEEAGFHAAEQGPAP